MERPAGQIDGRHRRPRAKGGGAHPGAGGDRLLVRVGDGVAIRARGHAPRLGRVRALKRVPLGEVRVGRHGDHRAAGQGDRGIQPRDVTPVGRVRDQNGVGDGVAMNHGAGRRPTEGRADAVPRASHGALVGRHRRSGTQQQTDHEQTKKPCGHRERADSSTRPAHTTWDRHWWLLPRWTSLWIASGGVLQWRTARGGGRRRRATAAPAIGSHRPFHAAVAQALAAAH